MARVRHFRREGFAPHRLLRLFSEGDINCQEMKVTISPGLTRNYKYPIPGEDSEGSLNFPTRNARDASVPVP